ncbi:centromere-associated protein E isoform X13 [Anguilla anguilla]|uniref:centromere-associated protein E isoform X13 n=1 Tax=Anguilla anguilla TaxID=7936 RepID=UPI0015B07E44|nr:centromere-associated protein E isoform X13 [Anguilla anguilla]
MTEESAVKVCVRVRPLIQREEASTENSEPVALYWKADKQAIHQIDDGSVTKTFSFDRVFSAEESTNQLYQDIAKPLVVSAVEGYNGTIFAYGQTSSGKTFTMMGSNRIPGVIPLAMEDVFQTIKNCPKKEFLLRVSYMEIYNETVTDLLCDSWKRKPLEIREGNYKNVYVADLTEELVTSAEQALSWIRKGEKNRHYGKTKMNQRSSRSHTIFRMILESRERSDPASGENADGAIIVSHLNLVDLAGAERASQTGAEGARLKEGCNINRSLFTLGQVIKKLSDENQGGFTNYRDSKLTRILQNSLGGNAKTVIICTITPATVEETISTLQFASAAKRMKNDPHVTEVSDDGALLRRYRNEIVDLKRRLQEVSSVTQTTATEKEVLAQLLQEKDQLQREQQDRIRNLTKIIVTSSNFVVAEKKVPKRRVTWGGKLFRPVQSGDLHIGDAEFGPSEPFVKKRKADLSVLLEQDDDSAEFDSQWETPDDIQFDIEMNQSNVTIRSVTDSDFPSPSRLGELSEKVASLEMQLQMETQQKQEAVEMSTSLEKRVAELEKQLEVQEQELLKDPQEEELGELSEKVASLEMQLQMKTQQKQEAVEMSTSLEKRVAELEKQLEVQEQELLKDPQEEYKKDLGDTIQLCEALVSEKANIAAERDLIKQELSILKDENLLLRRDKDHLLKEIEEKREMQEFSSLEQESAKQYEIELLAEISSIKKVAEKSVACVQKLEADMAAMSTLLKRKEEVIKELQNINGKDLVQENQQLRRSLADAEELSRETKKEWAFLRSDNLSLKERDSSMSTDYEKMKNEVTALCSKLEVEKSRFKKMQVDLQKELQGAFEENTKLTTLLDGKVPKNLIDSIELERTVTGLKKELEMHQEQESFLQSKVEELEALKDLPVQVESLKKQICDLTEELCAARAEKDCLLSAQTSSDAEIGRLTAEVQQAQDQLAEAQAKLSDAEIREDHLSQQHLDITQQAEELKAELKNLTEEKCQLLNTVEELNMKAERSREHETSIEGKLLEQQLLVKDLENKLEETQESSTHAEEHFKEISKQHQDQITQLSEELQLVRSERDAVQSERTNTGHLSEEEQEKLPSQVTFLTEERDQLQEILEGMRQERNQLKRELQEKEESVEGQAELLSAQEELKLQQQLNSDLQAQISEKESQLEQITQLSEELQLVRSERDALQSERTNTGHLSEEEQEELRSQVTSLTEERDQLQEILEGVREERNQLKRELQEKEVMSVEGQAELLSAQEELKLQQQLNSDLQAQISEKESQLQQITQLSEELQLVRSERDALQSERTNTAHLSEEEQEKLCSQVTSLTEERDQLQEILEGVREERNQLKRDLQEKEESVDGQAELLGAQEELKVQQQLNSDLQAQISEKESRLEQQVAQVQEELRQQQHLNSEHQALREREQAELHQQIQQLTEELEGVREERTKLQSDLQENTEMAKETQNLLHSIQEDLKQQQVLNADLKTQNSEIETRLELQIKQLNEELQLVRSERDALQSERTNTAHLSEEEQEKLRSQVTSLSEARDQLQEVLEGVREERSQLKRDLLEKEETLAQVQKQLLEKEHLNAEQQTLREKEQAEFQQQIQKLAEELEGVRKECQQKAELEKASQEALSEANAAIASLREQIRDLEEKSSPAGQGGERLRARLEESELELQKVLEKFQKFADSAAGALKSLEQPLKDASLVQNELAFQVLASIPKPLRALYVEFRKSTDGISDLLWRTARGSAGVAQLHRQQLEAQASQDAACFEESRLQDLLIRAARDPSDLLAATSDDFRQVWDQRLHELLERREQKLQEMNRVLAELEEGVARNAATVSEELPEQQRTNEELRALVTASTLDLAALESLLERERARRTLVLQSKKAVFLNLQNEYFKMGGDLKAFKAQASQQLKEERSRSLTLLQKRESGPAKSEAELLQSLQELTLKLQQSEMLVKVVQTRAGELEEAQARAEDRVSKHKEATQLLQTELQDVCAQLKEREGAVRGLEGKLRDSEVQVKRGMAPSAVELEEMKNKLIKMELELTARASTHQEELEKMTSMLDHKEEALRKLKEALRKTQQQGDESFMEESVYAKGTATIGGRTVQSSIVMEKNRLEEEVKQLKKKIVQLESLISSQQLEITKWKTRATKLKENRKEGVKAEMPLSPHTPTKRRRPITSEGHILDSPKSKFFDARSVSESVSANCPKQFFDNSTLGNVPEVLYPPTMPELGSPESPEIDLNAAVEDKNAEWWPMSPTQSDNCKTQ